MQLLETKVLGKLDAAGFLQLRILFQSSALSTSSSVASYSLCEILPLPGPQSGISTRILLLCLGKNEKKNLLNSSSQGLVHVENTLGWI